MFKKKMAVLMAVAVLAVGAMAGCGTKNQSDKNGVTSAVEPTAGVQEEQNTVFKLNYPSHMKTYGYTESLILEKEPETIVSLSTYPVLTLFEMGIDLAAVPSTKVISYPEDYDGVILPGMMSDTFDIETVVALEPELVIMPVSSAAQYGAALEELEIPVYYLALTSTEMDVYSLIKEQTQALVDAFSTNEEKKAAGDAVMARFAASDAALEKIAAQVSGKTVMSITVSSETSIYMNSESSTLGSMLKRCGLTNVYVPASETTGHSMAQMDMEKSLEYTPDLIVVCGSSTLEDNKALMDAIYALNPEYWDSYEAFKEGRVIYLSSAYVSTAGINIINNLDSLIAELEKVEWEK
ncbi:MAG: ABC transporter substrate-binding protein [Lachnospiraceae bacterium]|nr:ABC transporter substrate-binding protein [Lachnospiraceae bacterium]